MFNITIYTCSHVNSIDEMTKIKTNRKEVKRTKPIHMGILLSSLGIEKKKNKKHPCIPTLLDLDM